MLLSEQSKSLRQSVRWSHVGLELGYCLTIRYGIGLSDQYVIFSPTLKLDQSDRTYPPCPCLALKLMMIYYKSIIWTNGQVGQKAYCCKRARLLPLSVRHTVVLYDFDNMKNTFSQGGAIFSSVTQILENKRSYRQDCTRK